MPARSRRLTSRGGRQSIATGAASQRCLMRATIVILGVLAAAPAGASEAHIHRAQAPHQHGPDCYCRAQGRIFAPGERICLRTAEGPRLAECRMETNVMSWSFTAAPCPET